VLRFARRLALLVPLLALLAIVVGLPASLAFGDEDSNSFRTRFFGLNEVPPNITDATASLRLTIHGSGNTATITYTFEFSGLRAPVTQAHIHFSPTKVNGGIMVFLCGTAAIPGPAGTPTCVSGTTITRTLTASDVVGPSAQGITPGVDMGSVLLAIRAGDAYGNVHSTMFPNGEARGQLVRTDRN
jgi:hypothetical protein